MNKQVWKETKPGKLWTLFRAMFVLSACTFGGGFVIVSLMKKKFVEELGWLDEAEMLDITAITDRCFGCSSWNNYSADGNYFPDLCILHRISHQCLHCFGPSGDAGRCGGSDCRCCLESGKECVGYGFCFLYGSYECSFCGNLLSEYQRYDSDSHLSGCGHISGMVECSVSEGRKKT